MIVVLKKDAPANQVESFLQTLAQQRITPNVTVGQYQTIIGLVGDISGIDIDLLRALDIVESVQRIQEPYKLANLKFHQEATVVDCGAGVKIGAGALDVIAGPCSIESEEQLLSIAQSVKAAGATLLRGGAFKPRTSPYAFQGMGRAGLELLVKVKSIVGLPIVTEIMDINQLDCFNDVDVIQVGARNMQNFDLLKELGRQTQKPILLKRGFSATLQEWLMSAEYILASGNPNVILCERGIRTFEPAMRNTLDVGVVPLLRSMTHLPIVVDPSHATGIAKLVKPMALAATAVGADGLVIEVHNNPAKALCDGAQSLTPVAFADTMQAINQLRQAL